MITSDVLQNRINNFWGYGNLESPIWLVGMEEGFSSSGNLDADLKMIERQFNLPNENGMFNASRPLDHNVCDLTNLSPFLPNAKMQRTWEFPITLYLFLKNGKRPSENEILDFQHFILANGKKKEIATIELMPFPSPNTSIWLFKGIPGFETRKSLKAHKEARAKGLKKLVQKYSPKLVIFYSLGYLRDGTWTEVIGKIPEEVTHQMYFSKSESTSFCIIPQPGYLTRLGLTRMCAYNRLYEYAEKIKKVI